MTPSSPILDVAYSRDADSKAFSQCRLLPLVQRKKFSNADDLNRCKFGRPVPLALWRSMATARKHVLRVIGVASDFQVIRIAAFWVVARVTNDRAGGDCSMDKAPRFSVRQHGFVVPHKMSVPASITVAEPRPTLVCGSSRDAFPEWNASWACSMVRVVTHARAVVVRLMFHGKSASQAPRQGVGLSKGAIAGTFSIFGSHALHYIS